MRTVSVVHVITGLGMGGAEAMLVKLLAAMDRERFQSHVISLSSSGPLAEQIEALGVGVEVLKMRRALGFARGLIRLRRRFGQQQPVLVQGWMYHGNLAATLASRSKANAPVLWNIRQSLDDISQLKLTTQMAIRMGSRLSADPRRIIYNSKRGAIQHEQLGYRKCSREIIPNGFVCDTFKPSVDARFDVRRELGVSPDQLLVGVIGRFHVSKDHLTFLRAAARVASRHPNVKFLMVGSDVDSKNPEMTRPIAELGLSSKVYLLGERRDIPRLTAALDIASISSISEGFPNVVGEAMACGVPCAVTDVGDAAAIIGDSQLVAPPRDPIALASIFEMLIDAGPVGRQSLGDAARSRIVSKYSIDSVAACYEALYLQVADEAGI